MTSFKGRTARLCAYLILTLPAWTATHVEAGSAPGKVVFKGKMVTAGGVFDGVLVVDGDKIACAGTDCATPAGATVLTVTDAFIFPGFVDAHNHVAYNILPKWQPPKLYQNRGQWQASKSYKEFKKPYSELKDQKDLFCEMVKYGEVKALISGVTTIQGTSPGETCVRTLIRNAENQNELDVAASRIRTYILDISSFAGTVNWTVTRSFVVHIAEGLGETPRKEFDVLRQKHLLTGSTAIIHGTAFGDSEFQQMADVGAKLIWSPQSNLVLYGQTTNIKSALQHGVPVSLGVDWNPSGSDNIFDELRVAAKVNSEKFDGAIADADWVKMITANPARALALDDFIGDLKAGAKADITVLTAEDSDATQSLLKSHLEDVEMVWVGGEPLYGAAPILDSLKPGECEPFAVNGAAKRICVKDTRKPVPKSDQTLADITQKLKAAYAGLAPLVPAQ